MIVQMGNVAVKSIGRSPSTGAAAPSTGDICDSAVSALGRQSPAAPNLVTQCYAARIAQVGQRVYVPSSAFSPNDPAYRVALTNAGQAIVNASPELRLRVASMPLDGTDRGFTMAQGVRAGRVDPGFVSWVRGALVGPTLAAFDAAMAEPAGGSGPVPGGDIVQLTRDGRGGLVAEEEGVPKAVLIGAGVVGLGVLGLIAYKLTR